MTTYSWPTALRLAAFEAQLVPNVRAFISPYGGASQALDLLGERWRFGIELPPCSPADAGAREALFTKLRGGAHRVTLHHMARPQPVGSLRGSPTLYAGAAQGADSIVLTGAINDNLLLSGSFEIDSNVDGLADGWTVFVGGAGDGGRVHELSRIPTAAATHGTAVQFLRITSATNTNDSGIARSVRIAVTGGATYTMRADCRVNAGSKVYINARSYDGGSVQIADHSSAFLPVTGALVESTTTFTVASNAATIEISVRGITLPTEFLEVDSVQVTRGDAVAYQGPATVNAGDVLGLVGSHLVMASADATATDAGEITISLANRLRAAVLSGTAVTWYKPTADFMLAEASGVPVSHGPGLSGPIACDFLEVWS